MSVVYQKLQSIQISISGESAKSIRERERESPTLMTTIIYQS